MVIKSLNALLRNNIFFVFLFLFLFLNPANSFAQSSNGVQIQPAYVDVDLTENLDSKNIPLTYSNKSQNSITLELFPMDFRQTNPFGGIGFIGQDATEYSYSLSSFLSFETNRLDLEPGETKTIEVTAQNRQDLSPGGHYAAVIARQVQTDSLDTTISPAVSTLIYLRKLGGEIYNLSLMSLSWPRTISFSYPSTITSQFQNAGNIHLVPVGRMEVTDMFGRVLYKGILNEGFVRILPESRRFIPIYLKQLKASLPFSINNMSFKGTDSLKKVTFSQTEVFIYIHPLFAATVILLLIGILTFRKRRKSKTEIKEKIQINEQVRKPHEKSSIRKKKVSRRRKRK